MPEVSFRSPLGAGVVLGLFTDAECTNKIDEFTTDENGVAKNAVHDRGTYYQYHRSG